MPKRWGWAEDRREWPVKVLRGDFSWNKRLILKERYARRRIRVEFSRG